MSSIAGTSADNITAEGGAIIDIGTSDVAESVAFHFNGTSWSQMTIPAGVTLGPGHDFDLGIVAVGHLGRWYGVH